MNIMRHDFTDKFQQLTAETLDFEPFGDKWPMYSFDRPAYLFWNGVANYLRNAGYSDKEIREELQSKSVRWMLDHGPIYAGDVEELGYNAASAYFGGSR